eukprot:213308-Amphidinium_carterae.2
MPCQEKLSRQSKSTVRGSIDQITQFSKSTPSPAVWVAARTSVVSPALVKERTNKEENLPQVVAWLAWTSKLAMASRLPQTLDLVTAQKYKYEYLGWRRVLFLAGEHRGGVRGTSVDRVR